MKPVPIADYLDHIGRAPGEPASPRRETSPFRPRSLQSLQNPEPRPTPVFDRAPKVVGAAKPQAEAREQRPLLVAGPLQWNPLRGTRRCRARRSQGRGNGASTRRGACARTRGRPRRRAGRGRRAARGRARRSAGTSGASARLEFQLNEYAQLEAAIRSGFAQVEENVGAAVARILAPFLVKQVVKYVADELCKNIGRLCAGGVAGVDHHSGARAGAESVARANRRSAGRSRLCRKRQRRRRSSKPTPRKSSPSFSPGPSCSPRSTPERADERASGNRHHQAPQHARRRPSRRRVEDRFCRFHDRDDGVFSRPVDHQRDRQEHEDADRPLFQSR